MFFCYTLIDRVAIAYINWLRIDDSQHRKIKASKGIN